MDSRNVLVTRYHYAGKEYVYFIDRYKKDLGLFVGVYESDGKLTAQGVFPISSDRSRPWLFFQEMLIAAEVESTTSTMPKDALVKRKQPSKEK